MSTGPPGWLGQPRGMCGLFPPARHALASIPAQHSCPPPHTHVLGGAGPCVPACGLSTVPPQRPRPLWHSPPFAPQRLGPATPRSWAPSPALSSLHPYLSRDLQTHSLPPAPYWVLARHPPILRPLPHQGVLLRPTLTPCSLSYGCSAPTPGHTCGAVGRAGHSLQPARPDRLAQSPAPPRGSPLSRCRHAQFSEQQ